MGLKAVIFFVSGESFLVGIICMIIATILRVVCRQTLFHRLLRIVAVIGAACVAGSATPLPLWIYGVWCTLFIGSHLALDSQQFSQPIRRGLVLGFTLFSVLLFLGEYRYRSMPSIPVTADDSVYVIGDSLSSGLNEGEQPWPAVLAASTSLHIVNLARPGATLETAFRQLSHIHAQNALIFVEIGGNDFFGNTTSKTFRHLLDRLLHELHTQQHRIVMFELPLLPFYNQFGQAQRQLVKQYEILLIPRQMLADILGMAQGTTDGIHLSQKGHNALAERIRALLSIRGSGD